jgi:molybdenum cofactor synthesis domain-containing protein
VTVSTRAAGGVYGDRSGDRLAELVAVAGHTVARRELLPDDAPALTACLIALADSGDVDVIVTSGGTGITPTDHTPEATTAMCERLIPGIAEAIRAASVATVSGAMLSRNVAGHRGTTLVVNLPGSPGGASDGWAVLERVVEHAVSQLHGADHPRTAEG